MRKLEKNIYFFDWYETYYVDSIIPLDDHAMVIKKVTNMWKLPNRSKKVESIHPPLEQIKLDEIKATPLKNIESKTNTHCTVNGTK